MRSTSTFLFVLCFACACQPLFAQKLIALQHQGAASFYTDLTAAYNAAVNGDTLYIPGGSFGSLSLQKSLTLIGVGHHPDSTSATGMTILSSLNILVGADNSFITGISFTSPFYSSGNASGVVISKCFLNQGIFFQSDIRTNWIISENWIGFYPNGAGYSFYPTNGSSNNFFLSNNVFQGHAANLISSEISNNVFLLNAQLLANNSTIRNNVFASNYESSTTNSQWYNNLNSGVNGGPTANSNTGSANYINNVPLTTAFVSYSPGNSFYQNDFHVVNLALVGSDGTPVGIYGGASPWKAGSLPSNPHVRSKSIGSTTNPDGTLHINVVVKAQGN